VTTDHTAIVTGANHGIGAATAEALARRGCAVLCTYLRVADPADPGLPDQYRDNRARDAAAVIARVEAQGGTAVAVEADLSDPAAPSRLFDTAEERLGPVDVLVNNAGIKRDSALHNMDPAAWQDVIDTNLTGTFNYCRALMKSLIRHGGAVINVTSVSGIIGMAGQTNYSASKAGVIGFTKALAREVARFGVRVNAVAPGFIDTDMTASMDENARKKLYSQIPLGKPGTPKQVARAVLYLASEDAAYITGQVLTMDGGLS